MASSVLRRWILYAVPFFLIGPQTALCQDELVLREGAVKQALDKARQEGRDHADVPSPIRFPLATDSLAAAARNHSIIVATVLDRRTVVEQDALMTWYVLRVNEWLLRQLDVPVESEPIPPPDLVTTGPDQLLLAEEGGNVLMKGVKIRQHPYDEIRLEPGTKYFLIVNLEAGGAIGELGARGMGNLFAVDANRHLTPQQVSGTSRSDEVRSHAPPPKLAIDLIERFHGSLDEIRAYLTR